MSALVYWCDSKDSSVIPISNIETLNNAPPEPGNVYQIKWLKKTYTGRVLRISERASDFDDISVTEEGIVVDAVMRDPAVETLPSQPIPTSTGRKRKKEEAHKVVNMLANLENNFVLEDSILSLPALIQDRIPLPDTMCCRKACIEMLDRVITYAADLRKQLVEDNDDVLEVMNEMSSYPSGSGPIERKVELTLGSGVYINRREKLSIAKGYRDKPNEMVRQLVKAILGDSIKDMSARGTSGSKGIPREVIQAVQVFVADHSKEVSNKAMTKILNNMISGMRHPHKKRREMEAKEANEKRLQSGHTSQTTETHTSQSGNTTQENEGDGVHFMSC